MEQEEENRDSEESEGERKREKSATGHLSIYFVHLCVPFVL